MYTPIFAAAILACVSAQSIGPTITTSNNSLLLTTPPGGRVTINGDDLTAVITELKTCSTDDAVAKLDGKIDRLMDGLNALSDRLEHFLASSAPTSAPTSASSVSINGVKMTVGKTVRISQTRKIHEIVVTGNSQVRIVAAGSKGGNAKWSRNNNKSGPGGRVTGVFTLSARTYYAFVAQSGAESNGKAGGGGASSDVRTVYKGSKTSLTNKAFLQQFETKESLDSRIIVGGGGGGAHGGEYGYWGQTNSPGAGGAGRQHTNSKGSNDGGYTNTGATTSMPGLDGGSNMDAKYTNNGRYGVGGGGNSQQGVYQPNSVGGLSAFTGMTWPNGGAGTAWAAGGGGGGWHGGAGNWPNGGGGTNFVKGGQMEKNEGAVINGAGYIDIIYLK